MRASMLLCPGDAFDGSLPCSQHESAGITAAGPNEGSTNAEVDAGFSTVSAGQLATSSSGLGSENKPTAPVHSSWEELVSWPVVLVELELEGVTKSRLLLESTF